MQGVADLAADLTDIAAIDLALYGPVPGFEQRRVIIRQHNALTLRSRLQRRDERVDISQCVVDLTEENGGFLRVVIGSLVRLACLLFGSDGLFKFGVPGCQRLELSAPGAHQFVGRGTIELGPVQA